MYPFQLASLKRDVYCYFDEELFLTDMVFILLRKAPHVPRNCFKAVLEASRKRRRSNT